MDMSPSQLQAPLEGPVPADLVRDQSGATWTAGGIDIHHDIELLEERWRHLEATGVCTVYQSYDWLNAWIKSVGLEENTTPQFVTVADPSGRTLCILPLGTTEKGPFRILHWLGGCHSNYNLGLCSGDWVKHQTTASMSALVREILQRLPDCDAIHLSDQPTSWGGCDNPFYLISHRPSVNESYSLDLQPDYEDLYARKRSSSTRRSARKRDKRLAAGGALTIHTVSTSVELDVFIGQLLAQKRLQMDTLGVGDLFGQHFADFIKALGHERTASGLQLMCNQLMCGNDIAATVFGTTYKGRYYGLVLAMAPGPHARHSPGDLALRRTIETCCRSGITAFDFSQGEAAYKSTWADHRIDLFDTIVGVTAMGHIYAVVMGLYLALKRKIKKTPALFSLAISVRRVLRGAKPADAS